MRRLRVLLLAYGSNPYITQLTEHLNCAGVHVVGRVQKTRHLLPWINRRHVDVIHLHWLDPYYLTARYPKAVARAVLFLSCLALARIRGIRIIWTVHNLVNHEQRRVMLESFVNRFVASLSGALIVHSVSACKMVAAKCSGRTARKISVIYHGHYINWYPNKIEKREARNALELPQTDLVFLFLGIIRPYKGVLELIDTFKQCELTDSKLMIVGQPTKGMTDRIVLDHIGQSGQIRFTSGYLPDDQIQLYMNACDVVMLPYRESLTSGAAVLAMSFGRVVVAPRLESIEELCSDEGAILYDPQDDDGLLRALHKVADARSKLSKMGRWNLGRARRWNWEQVARATKRVYCGEKQVLTGSAPMAAEPRPRLGVGRQRRPAVQADDLAPGKTRQPPVPIKPMFLVGCPRSGTTLIQSLIGAHPQILALPETHIFPQLIGMEAQRVFGQSVRGARARFLNFCRHLMLVFGLGRTFVPERMKQLGEEMNEPILVEARYPTSRRLSVNVRILTDLFDQLARRRDRVGWIEKTPQHLHYLPQIKRFVSGAKCVHVVRDGRATVASLYDASRKYADWGRRYCTLEACIDQWNRDMRITRNYQSDSRHIIVSYHDAVVAPDAMAARVFEFLGLPVVDRIMDMRLGTIDQIVRPYEKWKNNLQNDLQDEKLEKFNAIFSRDQQRQIVDSLLGGGSIRWASEHRSGGHETDQQPPVPAVGRRT